MNSKTLTACVLGLSLIAAMPSLAQSSTPDAKAFVQKWDRSGKGLLDMKAIFNAGIVKFEMLDKEHKGRLTEQQLSYAVTSEEFRKANPDGDTTIGAEEWFGMIREGFYAANPDHDGSLSIDEFSTPAGQALLKLLD